MSTDYSMSERGQPTPEIQLSLEAQIEALIFVASDATPLSQLAKIMNVTSRAIEKGLELKHAANVYFNASLFDTYLRMGEYEKASSIAKGQLSRSISFLDVVVKAHVHQAKREYEEAIREFQILIQRSGPWAKLWIVYNLAQCYSESGQSERAIETIHTAQRIYIHYFGPARWRFDFYPRGFYLLGKIYEKKGDQKLAIENYEKFLDLWKDADEDLPDLIDAKERLAKLRGVSIN